MSIARSEHFEPSKRARTSPAPRSRREFFRDALTAAAPRRPAAPPQVIASATIPAPSAWSDVKLRLVRRATMGLTNADVLDVRQMGYQQWLNDQVHHTGIDDSAVATAVAARYPLLSQSAGELFTANANTVQSQLQESTIYRAAFSKRQLYERMVEFWSDHFNITITKVGYLKAVDDRDVIRKYALGKFTDLLFASAKSPAMLSYLDQNLSRSGNPNQNYARELMELHTLGVDGGYTQNDVAELSRVLTGWTLTGAGDFLFQSTRHDYTAKTVLGVAVPASSPTIGAAAIAEGESMLTMLANHPSTAKYIATKLLKWLLTPEPTTSQINTIAGVWRATKGDIKLVVRAILNDAWMGTAPVKFKRPFHYLVSALRATSANVTQTTTLNNQVRILGQQLFFWDTPDGYPDTAEYWSGNIQPRWSFANLLSTLTTQATIDPALYGGSAATVVDKIEDDYFGGELALSTRTALINYLSGGTFTPGRVRETIALALSSSDFQWY